MPEYPSEFPELLQSSPKTLPRFVLLAAAITGFAFFLMELVWYRMLAPLLGGSTFSFGLILATALLGIAVGSFLYSMVQPSSQITMARFALVTGFQALALVIPFALGDTIAVLAIAFQPLKTLGLPGQFIAWGLLVFTIVFPASVLAGVQFPMLIALVGRGRRTLGFQSGLVYAWNTAGAIVGSLAGGFFLLPWLTAPGAWRLVIAVIALLAGVALIIKARQEGWGLRRMPATAVVLLALTLLLSDGPSAAWRHSPIGAGRVDNSAWTRNDYRNFLHERRRDLFWEAEGNESSIALMHYGSLALLVNGKSDGNSRGDASTQVMLGLLGALTHPNPQDALVIGLGTGSTAGWLADVASVQRVDVVELEPAVVKVADFCAPVNRDVTSNPKVHLTIGDAREFVLTAQKQYDLIASEPSNPYRAGVASLFTREFYQAVAQRLRTDGLFLQWVQAYEVDGESINLLYATLASIFPAVDTWRTQSSDMLLIASKEPIYYDIPTIRARILKEPYRSALAHVWGSIDLEGVFARYVANNDLTRSASIRQAAVNTDDRNRLEFGFAKTVGCQTSFSLDLLTRIVREQGYNRPHLKGDSPNWTLMPDRAASARIMDGSASPYPEGPPGFSVRSAAKHAYVNGDFAKVCQLWSVQSQEPADLVELLILAQSYASQGDEKALDYIEKLQAWCPNEADAVLAAFYCRRGEIEAGLSLFESTFQAWQTDPWCPNKLVTMSLDIAKSVAINSRQASQAVRLYEVLKSPFAVYIADNERQRTLFDLAKYLYTLGVHRCASDYLASQEPHVPWTHDYLQLRAECYAKMNRPRASRAQRDLEQFERNTSKAFTFAARIKLDSIANSPQGKSASSIAFPTLDRGGFDIIQAREMPE